jgi:hypothetical protein
MTPQQFVQKWSQIHLNERAIAQTHFNDVCELINHPSPLVADPSGESFAFETSTSKGDGRRGFADVFYKGKFIWEYKGKHADLGKAYQQLLLYRDALENPPLLIVSDTRTIIIYTNFTNRPIEKHEIGFDRLTDGDGMAVLKRVFYNPTSFMPERTQQAITQANAEVFLGVADALKKHQLITGETYTPEQLSHFLVRLLFCLFAEDMGLLLPEVFSHMVQNQSKPGADWRGGLVNLFRTMRQGGLFGYWQVRYFDGTLFEDDFVPQFPDELGEALLKAIDQDWRSMDPSIFGTLFERVIDERKRAQLGAHFTKQEDIELLVEPVLMTPLRERWQEVKLQAAAGSPEEQYGLFKGFAAEITAVRVLDPACGSGNFLYVALHKLLDLQKEVIVTAEQYNLPTIPLTVSPQQLYGLEIDAYAYELARITVWIGYLQWRQTNGYTEIQNPILQPLNNIQRMDAILAYDETGKVQEPAWPVADVIIGNPPFLGEKKMRTELGDAYVEALARLYRDRLPACDLVCYWFERARSYIEQGVVRRAGFITTNSIRGGANREVLKRIKQTGNIFMAWSDNPWVLEGVAVRISIIGFDDGTQTRYTLNGVRSKPINPDLTANGDVTVAQILPENADLSFMGVTKQGDFDIDATTAQKLLAAGPNPNDRPNSDVIHPYYNGHDLTRRPRNIWIIDFGLDMSLEEAAQYVAPFAYVEQHVKPVRDANKRAWYREEWWLHYAPRPQMRQALASLPRYMATSMVARHRTFSWVSKEVLPANLLIVVARDDDYFYGVLNSHIHELWSLRLGTSLGKGNDPRYTPTTTFETFPMPWPPGQEPSEQDDQRVATIAHWARRLHEWREAWLNPPAPNGNGGKALDPAYQKKLSQRTLTNLYNGVAYVREHGGPAFMAAEFAKLTRQSVTRQEAEQLLAIHTQLDRAVLEAYGWRHDVEDGELLQLLLELNVARATLTAVGS